MKTVNYQLVGQKIRDKRMKLGITQEKLAELCLISVSYVAHIERGTRSLSLDTAVRVANALDMSLDFLLLDEIHSHSRMIDSLQTELDRCTPEQIEKFVRLSRVLIANIDEI
ncbi:MAG: helix-turn-helix transcriptional regulator [Oscillospiraceae bacterium]|nr:helix-turn-helix transcriptional regulator [Oscillospiraceae bacterium]MBQ7014117.1 helix-turn-helix transcriptional regulator [Oscillospiraceae bacterium]